MLRGEAIRGALAEWRVCRAEFEQYREAAYEAAHEGCCGVLLNGRGRTAGIDPWSLFIGPARRAEAYASRELLDWWLAHPRVCFQQFETAWVERRWA